MLATFSPSFPLGDRTSRGHPPRYKKNSRLPRARRRSPRERTCVQQRCGRKYHARRWNQRYCQDPECLREVNRWLAARRQAKRRKADTAKAQHAQAEKARRQRAKSSPKVIENPKLTPARGHAAKLFFPLPYAIGRAATNPP